MEVRWRISGRCKNVTRHKFGGIFGHVMTKISLSKVTIRSYLGLSGGSPPDAFPSRPKLGGGGRSVWIVLLS